MQLNSKIQDYIYWLTFLVINFLSLNFKLGKLDFVEYKYDQKFAFEVLNNCRNGKLFNYIDSSAGIPAGPFLYLYECIGGISGITTYKSLLVFEIVKEKDAGLVELGFSSKLASPNILVISSKFITGSVIILRVIVEEPEL